MSITTSCQTRLNCTDEPLNDVRAERDAIRDALAGTDMHILRYYGDEPLVALVNRDCDPPSEYTIDGEVIVVVEWHDRENYLLSVAEGNGMDYDLTADQSVVAETRTEVIKKARELFERWRAQ